MNLDQITKDLAALEKVSERLYKICERYTFYDHDLLEALGSYQEKLRDKAKEITQILEENR